VIAAVPVALYVRVDSMDSRAAVTVQARSGKSYFNFRDGQEMRVDYRGEQNLTEALQAVSSSAITGLDVLAGNAVPRFDRRLCYNGEGLVTVQHGNPTPLRRRRLGICAHAARLQSRLAVAVADTYLVPESPDFLQVGDFNHDNRKDVLVAARGGDLFLLAGEDKGD